VEGHPVGFVWNDGLRAAIDDFGAKAVAIVAFVPNEGRHGRREFQKSRPCSNICFLSRSKMKCARFAIGVAQRVDFRGPPTARAADRLFTLPPFPPLAERCALIEVESRGLTVPDSTATGFGIFADKSFSITHLSRWLRRDSLPSLRVAVIQNASRSLASSLRSSS
jgi:hypothetical protein